MSADGYNLYRGADTTGTNGASCIDYGTAVAFVPAGGTSCAVVGLGHAADTDYWYCFRAVSAAGVEETNTDRVVRFRVDEAGAVASPPPNRLDWLQVRPISGGRMRAQFKYRSAGQGSPPDCVRIAPVVGGSIDWENFLALVTITGSCVKSVDMETVYSHGESVTLAARAEAADGTPGQAVIAAPAVADSMAPDANYWLQAVQEGD